MDEIFSNEHKNGCLEIVLNKPKSFNALSLSMINKLTSIFQKAKKNKEIKFILLTSNCEKAFCAGGKKIKIKKRRHKTTFRRK
jgi:enoyl-CoA hydratase/carnithine racemase